MPERSISAFWDARAQEEPLYFVDARRSYGDGDTASLWSSGEADLDRLLDLVGERIARDAIVLELGCGVGRMTRAIAGRAREVVAVDVSSQMLGHARKLCAELDNVRWLLGDGTSLDGVGDGTVDACISYATLQHVPDPATTLGYVREVGRVLSPGGWAALQLSTDTRVQAAASAPRWSRGRVGRLRGGAADRPAALRDPEWLGSAVGVNALHVASAAAGLELERIIGSGSRFAVLLARRVGRAG